MRICVLLTADTNSFIADVIPGVVAYFDKAELIAVTAAEFGDGGDVVGPDEFVQNVGLERGKLPVRAVAGVAALQVAVIPVFTDGERLFEQAEFHRVTPWDERRQAWIWCVRLLTVIA